MNRPLPRMALCVALLLAGAAHAAAAELESAITACRAEQDAGARLACYDREADRLGQAAASAESRKAVEAPATASVPSSTAAAGTAAAATAGAAATAKDAEFGSRGTELARAESARKEEETAGQPTPSVTAKVTKVGQRGQGELVVSLDNGQIWAQKKLDPKFRLAVGEEVKIEPGLFGSYMMWGAASKRTTRVTRLR